MSKSKPDALITKGGAVYIKLDTVIKSLEYWSKVAIRSFKKNRTTHIQELLNEDDMPVDVRFENDITKMNTKNMKIMADSFINEFKGIKVDIIEDNNG